MREKLDKFRLMTLFRSKLLSDITGLRHGFDGVGAPEPQKLFRLHQVHGDAIEELVEETTTQEELLARKADGVFTPLPERTVGVQTADCIPALFASRSTSWIGAVHAGWRGLHKGILLRAVERFTKQGIKPSEICVVIGPAIGPCCFEAGQDVVDLFERDWGHLWMPRKTKPWSDEPQRSRTGERSQAPRTSTNLWINLPQIARLQLASAGMPETNIEEADLCTYCGSSQLASYRRGTHERQKTLRQWSWISRV